MLWPIELFWKVKLLNPLNKKKIKEKIFKTKVWYNDSVEVRMKSDLQVRGKIATTRNP